MRKTCAIILAAGESTRMGTNKLLLPFWGTPIIIAVIDSVIRSGLEHILVILGAFRDEMIEVVQRPGIKICYNPDYKQGMLTSVQCGFRNMPENTDAALIFLGDQPMIKVQVIREIIRSRGTSEKGILIPVYKNKRGHPVLIDRRYAGEIEELDPSAGLRALTSKYRGDIQEVEMEASGILRDIDTVEDYRNEIKLK